MSKYGTQLQCTNLSEGMFLVYTCHLQAKIPVRIRCILWYWLRIVFSNILHSYLIVLKYRNNNLVYSSWSTAVPHSSFALFSHKHFTVSKHVFLLLLKVNLYNMCIWTSYCYLSCTFLLRFHVWQLRFVATGNCSSKCFDDGRHVVLRNAPMLKSIVNSLNSQPLHL